MKPLLLICLLAIVAGCRKEQTGRPIIIQKFYSEDKSYCTYYYNGYNFIDAVQFEESCDKYQIGDTIK
jgi:hypothetical protein